MEAAASWRPTCTCLPNWTEPGQGMPVARLTNKTDRTAPFCRRTKRRRDRVNRSVIVPTDSREPYQPQPAREEPVLTSRQLRISPTAATVDNDAHGLWIRPIDRPSAHRKPPPHSAAQLGVDAVRTVAPGPRRYDGQPSSARPFDQPVVHLDADPSPMPLLSVKGFAG